MFAQHITPNFRVRIGKTPAPNKAVFRQAGEVRAGEFEKLEMSIKYSIFVNRFIANLFLKECDVAWIKEFRQTVKQNSNFLMKEYEYIAK
jgi:hypothetical protein